MDMRITADVDIVKTVCFSNPPTDLDYLLQRKSEALNLRQHQRARERESES